MYKNSENIMKTKNGAYIMNDNMIKVTGGNYSRSAR